MATQVPFATAVKVALEVKKHLVDNDQLNVTQVQLEAAIFMFLRRRGLPEDCIFQYRLLSSFHQRRQALVILIAGSVLCHKSAIASQLSQRMNLGNVLNVDCVARLMLQPNANELMTASTQDGSAQSSFGPSLFDEHFCCVEPSIDPLATSLQRRATTQSKTTWMVQERCGPPIVTLSLKVCCMQAASVM